MLPNVNIGAESAAPQTTLGKDFIIEEKLGSGLTAKVYRARRIDTGETFAIKVFCTDNPAFDKQTFTTLRQEVEATNSLNHDRIVKYHQFCEQSILTKANGKRSKVAYIV